MTTEDHGNHNANGQDIAAAIRAAIRRQFDTDMPPAQAAAFAENYRNSMNFYRRHGQEYLAAGDYRQAAEKSWGAFASSVKSIAADYGMKITFHGSIINVAGRLATLAAQDDQDAGEVISSGLGLARSLHQHFYENDLPPGQVIFSAGKVAVAIDLMQQRFASGPVNGREG